MTIKLLENPCRSCCITCTEDKNACESRKERRRATRRAMYAARKAREGAKNE